MRVYEPGITITVSLRAGQRPVGLAVLTGQARVSRLSSSALGTGAVVFVNTAGSRGSTTMAKRPRNCVFGEHTMIQDQQHKENRGMSV